MNISIRLENENDFRNVENMTREALRKQKSYRLYLKKFVVKEEI